MSEFKMRFYINCKGVIPEMQEKVKDVLDKVRPYLVKDGGDVELVDVDGGIVKVRLTGHCAGCPHSTMTLKNGIEKILKQEIPEVTEVVNVK